jgi:phosphoglycerate kinase
LGGAKVSDKIGVSIRLLDKADSILIGGGMCLYLLCRAGFSVGDSICEMKN